jgi:hypothetical protein
VQQYFCAYHSRNRYCVSARDKLKTDADGSTDVYIQADSPGKDRQSNWLAAPKDEFVLMTRMYWRKHEYFPILDGSWKIPAVKKAN